MTSTLLIAVADYFHGLGDAITGLLFLRELDRDEEFVAINGNPNAELNSQPKTVLQRRREQNGAVRRPAEPIYRHRVRAWKRVIQCILANTCFVMALAICMIVLKFSLGLMFDGGDHLGVIACYFIVVPIFAFTKIVMALWFSDIAGACMRAIGAREPPPVDIRIAIADLLASVILGVVFLMQSLLVDYLPIPVLSHVISLVHLALLNAMYCFEYYWSSTSIMLNRRILNLEQRWVYFIGFGTPLTIATSLSDNFLINGCIFSALFPFFIISSHKANWKRIQAAADVKLIPAIQIFTPSRLITDRVSKFISHYYVR